MVTGRCEARERSAIFSGNGEKWHKFEGITVPRKNFLRASQVSVGFRTVAGGGWRVAGGGWRMGSGRGARKSALTTLDAHFASRQVFACLLCVVTCKKRVGARS
jgi:hypothetical protein